MTDVRARLQHHVDQIAAGAGHPRAIAVEIRELLDGEQRWIDDFEPGSQWGGYSEWTNSIVLDPAYVRDHGDDISRLAVTHAVGCAIHRSRRRHVRGWCHAVLDGLTMAGMALSSVPLIAPCEFTAEHRRRSSREYHRAVVAGDAFCWNLASGPQRYQMIALIRDRRRDGARQRLVALTS